MQSIVGGAQGGAPPQPIPPTPATPYTVDDATFTISDKTVLSGLTDPASKYSHLLTITISGVIVNDSSLIDHVTAKATYDKPGSTGRTVQYHIPVTLNGEYKSSVVAYSSTDTPVLTNMVINYVTAYDAMGEEVQVLYEEEEP